MKRTILISAAILMFLVGAAIPFRFEIIRAYAELRVSHREVELQIEREALRRQFPGLYQPTFTEIKVP